MCLSINLYCLLRYLNAVDTYSRMYVSLLTCILSSATLMRLIHTAECVSLYFNLYSLLRYLNAVHSFETHLRSRISIRDLVFDVTAIALDMWRQCGFFPSSHALSCQLSLHQRCIFRVIHFLSTARSLVQWPLIFHCLRHTSYVAFCTVSKN